MFSMSLTALFSIGCLVAVAVLMAFSRYREWLFFLLGGMVFWLVVEFFAYGLRLWIDMPFVNSYAIVFLIFIGFLTIGFAIHDHKMAKQEQVDKYLEHTPLCEAESSQPTVKS